MTSREEQKEQEETAAEYARWIYESVEGIPPERIRHGRLLTILY